MGKYAGRISRLSPPSKKTYRAWASFTDHQPVYNGLVTRQGAGKA